LPLPGETFALVGEQIAEAPEVAPEAPADDEDQEQLFH
jgi:hypothetical protein